jgi:ATP synthase protein I
MNIDELKKKIDSEKKKIPLKVEKNNSAFGIAMKMGTEFVAAVFVATLIGLYLDKWLETSPFLIIVFFVIGSVAGILNVVRSSKMINKD